MREGQVISTTRKPNTINSIYEDLINIGINSGDIVLVHSSLSRLGWVCGGPQAVIAALMKSVGSDGTLVMPAHSGDLSDPALWENPPVPKEWMQVIYENMPAFEPEITPSRGMGRIAELFRTFPETKRSNHPHGSFCANGREAKHITENHPLTPQFGMDSPIGKMYNLKAKVLLLGVGYGNCTSFHLAESLIDKMPKARSGAPILENGEKCWKWFEDYDFDTEDFELIGKDFEKAYNVQKGKVGNAECKLFNMKDGVDFAKVWLTKNRF
jgi:aminoglycoside 3-N-acetyltransferase